MADTASLFATLDEFIKGNIIYRNNRETAQVVPNYFTQTTMWIRQKLTPSVYECPFVTLSSHVLFVRPWSSGHWIRTIQWLALVMCMSLLTRAMCIWFLELYDRRRRRLILQI